MSPYIQEKCIGFTFIQHESLHRNITRHVVIIPKEKVCAKCQLQTWISAPAIMQKLCLFNTDGSERTLCLSAGVITQV